MGAAVRLSRTITAGNRAELVRAIEAAPLGAQFDLIDEPRTGQQNRLMWKLLAQVSDQVEHAGEKYQPEDWKCAFMKALGYKLTFMPALDGDGVVALGYRSSKRDKAKFSELIELIYSEGLRRGVVFDAEAS
jgi:NinB protein